MRKLQPHFHRSLIWLLVWACSTVGCAAPRANGAAETRADGAAETRDQRVVEEKANGLETVPNVEVGDHTSEVQRQLAKARDAVQQRLEAAPQDPVALGEAFGQLGMVLNAYQFLDAAAAAYRNAAELAPMDARWPYYLAFCLQLQGQLDQAKTLYRRVLEFEPDDATTHLRLAETLFEANEPVAAQHHFERALTLRPRSAAAHFGLGRIATAQERHIAAIEHFEQAIKTQPDATVVHYPLAIALRQAGDLQRAAAQLERQGQTEISIPDPRLAKITSLGRGPGYHRLRGEVALAEERCEPAIASFERALAEAPGNRESHAGLAAALRQCGDFPGAINHLLLSNLTGPSEVPTGGPNTTSLGMATDRFKAPARPGVERLETPVKRRLSTLHRAAQEALETDRRDHAAVHFGQLAQLYLAYGLDDAARSHFEAARQLYSAEPTWGYFLAVLDQQRDPQRARGELLTFLERRPNDSAAWTRLGQLELELGQRAAAEKAFRHVLELDADHAAACFGLGRTALANDQPESAVAWLERALAQQPDAGRAHHVLGQAFRRSGDLDRARSHLAKADDREVLFDDPLIGRLGDVLTLTAFEVVLAMAANPEVTLEDHLGYALSKLGGVQGAAEKLTDALRLDLETSTPTTQARLHYVAGGLWVRRSVDARAEEHFRSALELDSKLLDAHVKLGNIQARQSDWRGAVVAYSAALDRRSDHLSALTKRAAAFAALGDLARAADDLQRLVRLAPGDVNARIQLARLLEQRGDAKAGYDLLRDSQNLSTSEAAAVLTARGDLEQRGGAFEPAIESYLAAVSHDSAATRPRLQLAATLGHLGRLEDALGHYAQLLALEPGHVEGRLGQTTCLILLGRHREAREQLEEGLLVTPGDLDLSHFLARLLASAPGSELRDGERAVALALAVYRRQASPQAAETVAMALAEAGRFAEARTWQRRLIEETDSQPDNGLRARLQPQLAAYESDRAWRAASPDQLIVLPSTG